MQLDLEGENLFLPVKYCPISVTIVVLRVNPQSLATDPSLVLRGFFIQARLAADDSNVGGFLSPQAGEEYQLSSCMPATVSWSIILLVEILFHLALADWCHPYQQ